MTSIFFVQCIIKQLLDSVFVISRIIKVSVRLSAEAAHLYLDYRRFHGRGRHLGSGANAAKFTVNVWEKS